MSEGTTEARPRRKSLGEQLDRLDGILDVLADGLPQAVSESARASARAVVREVLVEVLTDPDLRRRIAVVMPRVGNPTCEAGPGSWARAVDTVRTAVVRRWDAVRARCVTLWANLGPVPVRRVLAVSTGAGLVAGLGVLLAPVSVAAVLAGMGAASLALAVQLALAWAQTARRSAE
jgi:hypothetical protein